MSQLFSLSAGQPGCIRPFCPRSPGIPRANDLKVISESPFNVAGRNPNGLALLKKLVAKGVDTQAADDAGFDALHNAANGNPNTEVLTFLLNQGLPLNEPTGEDSDHMTPLMLAVPHNPNPEIIRLLVQRGANPAKKDANGKLAWEGISPERLPGSGKTGWTSFWAFSERQRPVAVTAL